MARITVEDCLRHVDNRFDLVLKAATRAHALEMGSVDPLVSKDNDKPTVIALREIAAGYDVSEEAMDISSSEPKTGFPSVGAPATRSVTGTQPEDIEI